MGVRTIVLILLAAGACVHSEGIDSADAEYCFDFRNKTPSLLLVKTLKNLEIRTAEDFEDSCEPPCRSIFVDWVGTYGLAIDTEIDFINESGKSIETSYMRSGMGWGWGCYPCDTAETRNSQSVPTRLKLRFPKNIYEWRSKRGYNAAVSKELLLFTNKTVDGRMLVSTDCKPHKDSAYYSVNKLMYKATDCTPKTDTTYRIDFRAKITGKCATDFLRKYDRDNRRGVE